MSRLIMIDWPAFYKWAESQLGCCADGLMLAGEEAAGAFRLAQYGPLNSLSTRVNEVLLRVQL